VLAFASDEEVFSAIEEIVSVVLDGGLAMEAEAVFGGYFLKKVRRRGGNERASSMCCCVMCETAMVNGDLERSATRAAIDVSWRWPRADANQSRSEASKSCQGAEVSRCRRCMMLDSSPTELRVSSCLITAIIYIHIKPNAALFAHYLLTSDLCSTHLEDQRI